MRPDPSFSEMLDLLVRWFPDSVDTGDAHQAIYHFASDFHSGLSSNLYRAITECGYKPGPLESLEANDYAWTLYETLMDEYDHP